MLNDSELQHVANADAYDPNGDKIGSVGQIFLDDQTGQPAFVSINTGLFGMNESFAPIDDASLDGDRLVIPFDKDQVKDAPNVDLNQGHLEPEDEDRLFKHYNYAPAAATGETHGDVDVQSGDVDRASADGSMTLSEEKVKVGTVQQEAGRARLRKYVTTEMETVQVPVRKEHAVIEREPITDGDTAAGASIGEEEAEVVLHEERAVVDTEAVAVEKVSLGTETRTEEETVSAEVRKEHVEVDGDVENR